MDKSIQIKLGKNPFTDPSVVIVNGVDISDLVRCTEIRKMVGELPTVVIHLIPDVVTIEGHANVNFIPAPTPQQRAEITERLPLTSDELSAALAKCLAS